MNRRTISLALCLVLGAQAADLPAQTPPDSAEVYPHADSSGAPAQPDENHCPGRRAVRVAIMTAAGAVWGRIMYSLGFKVWGQGGDATSRALGRKWMITFAVAGAAVGTRDALREQCEDLPYPRRKTRREP